MKERRYKEYKRFFQFTQLLFAATIASFSESYFEVHVPAVEGGDGAALWRRMKSHDMDEDSVVSFDIFSRLFAIQQGARSLIDYFSEFMTLRRSFIRMTSHDEDLKIPPKIWILLFCDRLSSEFKELLVNLKSLGTDIYSKSLDQLYQTFATYARDKDIPNEIGKKSSGGTVHFLQVQEPLLRSSSRITTRRLRAKLALLSKSKSANASQVTQVLLLH